MRLVPVRTSTMRIGADRRVGLKNSRDCDDRILECGNGGNRAAGVARTFSRYQQGYATVGVIVDLSNPTNPYTYLGER